MYKFKVGCIYDGISYQPGKPYELPKELAKKFIDDGICMPADHVRTASADLGNVENTSKKNGKKVL